MSELKISADDLVTALLNLPAARKVCLLDSCGVSNLGSRYLIAGFDAVEILEINESDANKTLEILDEKLSRENLACIFTISYEFGLKLNNVKPRPKEFPAFDEPDVFLALFDCLIIHDYARGKTFLRGDEKHFAEIEKSLFEAIENQPREFSETAEKSSVVSNFTRKNYLETIERIQEFIRCGDTYQTNLTQQLRAFLSENLSPEQIFLRLRKNHPAPFAAFLRRETDVVISASPERFFKVQNAKRKMQNAETESVISVSPIKGTRPRGKNSAEDLRLREELLRSEKDRAENVMIVDLLRNDIGRICEYGSVKVGNLCDLETHPTFFHLVSTVRGNLRGDVKFSDILKAVFPCGSITGAPKIRTMQIIDALETAPRGLSMGAIGYSIQNSKFKIQNCIDLSVAIRTMVIKNQEAIFNVGGGIVIDSISDEEYAETLVKAKALLKAINAAPKF
ncbi:MAG: aminodeoxychorismate synthase component I [Pyrinomonadaceae bacterium]